MWFTLRKAVASGDRGRGMEKGSSAMVKRGDTEILQAHAAEPLEL